MKYPPLRNYVSGACDSFSGEHLDVVSPLDGSLLSRVPRSDAATLDGAVAAARRAFPEWSGRTIKERSQVFYAYRQLLERNFDRLAEIVHEENGKTLEEGRAEVAKAIEVTEFACSLPQLTTGEVLEVSPG
ncbi:MAG: aldehyde dehydrogenase family protein, partial [Planctomycetales bacterium]|nr:aldehyde dehydrogenase family protein [Planctomycetales bacterium]